MARDKLSGIGAIDTTPAGSSVLWSFIQGEQLEFEVQLGFVVGPSWSSSLTYEARVVEGACDGTGAIPTAAAVNGATHTVIVSPLKAPVNWVAGAIPYEFGDTVYFTHPTDGPGIYRFSHGISTSLNAAGTSFANPSEDAAWVLVAGNEVYLRFPGIPDGGAATTPITINGITTTGVGAGWAVPPTPVANVYGFFELRVTEGANTSGFSRTWKPLRGLVELLYSPTLAS
jgi:hypothetical protein